MQFQEHRQERILRLSIQDRSLVKRPDWGAVLARAGSEIALVALDLGQVEFISSLFVEGCLALKRLLEDRQQRLVLVNLSPDHQRLLELVGGPGKLPVARDEAELRAELSSLKPDPRRGPHQEGVTPAEKNALWG